METSGLVTQPSDPARAGVGSRTAEAGGVDGRPHEPDSAPAEDDLRLDAPASSRRAHAPDSVPTKEVLRLRAPESDRRAGAASRRPTKAAGRWWRLRAVGLVLPVLVAGGWELVAALDPAAMRLMPPPSVVWATMSELAAEGDLSAHVLATSSRVLIGFGLGAAAGTLLGVMAGMSPVARSLVDPTLQALRAVPSIAWVPLFILWLGIFETSKVALIAVGVFFPVYLGVAGALVGLDRKWLEVGRVFRLSRWALAHRVTFPAILPAWVVSLRSGLGLGFMFVVAAEIMGASEGLGYLLVDGQQMGKADQIVGAIVAFALLGKLADGFLMLVTRPLLAWQDVARRTL